MSRLIVGVIVDKIKDKNLETSFPSNEQREQPVVDMVKLDSISGLVKLEGWYGMIDY